MAENAGTARMTIIVWSSQISILVIGDVKRGIAKMIDNSMFVRVAYVISSILLEFLLCCGL